MAPPWFFGFRATKSPKLSLGTFLGLKTTWEAILNIFRSLCLVARRRQISIDIIVEKFKIFRFSPNARGPPKIFDVNFFQFFEKQTPKLAFWDLANMERNKVRNFG